MKLKDLFKKAGNTALRSNPITGPAMILGDVFSGKYRSQQKQPGDSVPSPFVEQQPPAVNVNPGTENQPPAQSGVPSPLFNGSQPPAQQGGGQGGQGYQSKYVNPETGERYDPNDYSDMVAKRLTGGAVGVAAGDAIVGDQNTQQIQNTARNMNNARNDIATGETDPYGVGADSGIAYTPAELKAIENAQAGIYDPALQSVFSRLETKQKQDSQKDEGFTLSEGQTRYDAQGNVVAGGNNGSEEFDGVVSQEAKNLASAIQADEYKMSDVKSAYGEDMQRQVLNQIAQNPKLNPMSSNALKGASTVVRDAKDAIARFDASSAFTDGDNPKGQSVIGANQRWINSGIRGNDEWEIERLIQSVKDNVGIDALLNIKREGSGLGQVPQKQLESLQGLVGRLEVSRDPALLRRDLVDVLGMYEDIMNSLGGSILRSDEEESDFTTEEAAEFESIYGYNPLAFNNVGNTRDSGNGLINTANADSYSDNNRGVYNPNVSFASREIAPSSQLATAMQSIANIESRGSGGYSAIGPLVKGGLYKGEKALGRYQVMPGNLDQWGREAVGRSVNPEEFLNDPELQDKIVAVQFMKNYKKYGNWDDAASVWFTGKPQSRGGNTRDSLGTSGNQYVARFAKEFKTIT